MHLSSLDHNDDYAWLVCLRHMGIWNFHFHTHIWYANFREIQIENYGCIVLGFWYFEIFCEQAPCSRQRNLHQGERESIQEYAECTTKIQLSIVGSCKQ